MKRSVEESLPSNVRDPIIGAPRENARTIDLATDNNHLVRAASIESIPSILRFGIVSDLLAREKYGIKFAPQLRSAQLHLVAQLGQEGADYISIFDPKQGRGTSCQGIIQLAETIHGDKGRFEHAAYFLISPSLRETDAFRSPEIPKDVLSDHRPALLDGLDDNPFFPFEAHVKTKIEPAGISGIVIGEDVPDLPISEYIKRIIAKPIYSPMTWRELFASSPFKDQNLDTLRSAFLASQGDLRRLLLSLAERNGFNPQKDRLGDFFSYLPYVNFPYPQNRMQSQTNPGEDFSFSVDTQRNIQVYEDTLKELNDKFETQTIGPEDNTVDGDNLQLMRKILDERVKRFAIERQIWTDYIEGFAGKSIEEPSVGDFLTGLARQLAIPLYDRSGKVLWPE